MTGGATSASERLTIALDLRSPFSYLALRPSFELVDETGVEVEWLPVRALTLSPPSRPGPGDDRGVRHRRYRAEMLAREIEVYAAAQGLTIEGPYRDGGADAVHLAWLWLRDGAPARFRAFLEEAFGRYWSRKLDPEQLDDVSALLDELALDGARFRHWADRDGPAALSASQARAAELGLLQAPAYRWQGELFLGRQHLPMLRWLLSGRSGEVPI